MIYLLVLTFVFIAFILGIVLIAYFVALKKRYYRKTYRITNKPKEYLSDEEKGRIGEYQVKIKLQSTSNDVKHKEIHNLIVMDNYGNTHQIDHVEIRENGIFCIETKNYSGLIFGGSNQTFWTQCLNKYTKNKIPNPLNQNRVHVAQIRRVLGYKYKVNSIVVMVQNNAYNIKAINVINVDFLKTYLEDFDGGINLSYLEIDNIYNALMKAGAGLTDEEHLENLRSRGIKSN